MFLGLKTHLQEQIGFWEPDWMLLERHKVLPRHMVNGFHALTRRRKCLRERLSTIGLRAQALETLHLLVDSAYMYYGIVPL
jgi:hypothetical protein